MKWIGAAILVIALGLGSYYGYRTYRIQECQKQAQRISRWVDQGRAQRPAGVEAAVWEYAFLNGLHNAVRNFMVIDTYVQPIQVKKLADYLDATQGKDLQTIEGVYGIMDYIESMHPHCAGYFGAVRLQIENEFGLKPTPKPVRVP